MNQCDWIGFIVNMQRWAENGALPPHSNFEPPPARPLMIIFNLHFLLAPVPLLPTHGGLTGDLFWLLDICSQNEFLSLYPAGHGSQHM